ncbi:ankyrin repeat-containing domain protein [Catenaria anguillulae PL171]|uniref:Ankyrin repeat-containing domain protein n=1 Tax=Catenaria anguillulae PL171 TaxID=765915 RepID=A0A1Y2HBH0_9FUNG|nr:ankyrin repeat-containing domain protein [Catenaria anguillulae PL171]
MSCSGCAKYVWKLLGSHMVHSLSQTFWVEQNASADSIPITKRLALANALDHPVDHHGNTALHLAVLHGDVPLIALLLRKGADPNVQNAAGMTPLETTKSLHESDSPLHSIISRFGCLDKDESNCRPAPHLPAADLMAAGVSPHKLATLGQTWHLIPLLNGSPTTASDPDGITPLMRASAAGRTETVTRLIARGVDIHARDANGWTALTWACAGGWSDTVTTLLKNSQAAGAFHVSSKTSPLAVASFFGHDSIVAQLVTSHIKPSPASLMLAAWMQHPRVLSKLITAGVAIPQPFSDWLANGRRARSEWENKHCIVVEPAADSAIIASPSTSISGNLSPSTLADLEVDRVLTVASPETALVAGKQLVKSVPTKTAHQATSELRAELLSAEATPERALRVRGGGVPRFRRGPVFETSELAGTTSHSRSVIRQ